ncbi:O-antigen ligase family protein [bacterium]|nr:O-antigen ligase family protein [bacterium]
MLKSGQFWQKITNWLLTILVSTLPFVFCWASDELFEFNKMLYVYVFVCLIGFCYVARMITSRQFIYRRSLLDWPLVLFLLSQIISTLLSWHPRTSWLGYYTRLNGGLLSTLAYLVLYAAAVSNLDRSGLRRLCQGLFVSSILVSLYAAGEHFGHSFSCLIIKGHFNVACWVQDVQNRVYATFGQPNWLAAYNVFIIGLGTAFLLDDHHLFSRHDNQSDKFSTIVLPLSVYLNYASLIFTKSRSGILAFFTGLFVTIILFGFAWWRRRQPVLPHLRRASLVLAGFILISLIWGTQYTPSWQQIIHRAQAQETIDMGLPAHLQGLDVHITDSADIRKIVWRGALDIWRHYPWFGTGVETFAYSYYAFRPTDHNWTSEWDFLYNKAHNELLNLAANSGTFGLLTYLSLFAVLTWVTITYLWSPRSENNANFPLLIGIFAATLALSVTNFFGFSTVTVQVLMYLFFGICALIITDQSALSVRDTLAPARWSKPALAVSVVIATYLLSQVYFTWEADRNYALCKKLITSSAVSVALPYCAQAVRLRPQEALYQVELADYYAQVAVGLSQQNPDSSQIQAFIDQALALSNHALRLNPHHLNYYKTRARTLSVLSTLQPDLLEAAQSTLQTAMQLSPTDPKLTYNYANLLELMGDTTASDEYLQKTLDLRPLYGDARRLAAQRAQQRGDLKLALSHYRYYLAFIEPNDQDVQIQVEQLERQLTEGSSS